MARRRLHGLGVTAPLLRGIAEILGAQAGDVVLDAGCGDGFYLGTMARETGFDAHGVDISTFAADAAARRFPPGERLEWIVANADRFVPYADRSFSIVLSITARMNAAEFRRVLRDDGRLLVALPSPEDLAELRSHGWARPAGIVWLGRWRRSRLALRLQSNGVSPLLPEAQRGGCSGCPAVDLPAASITTGGGDARDVQFGFVVVSAALVLTSRDVAQALLPAASALLPTPLSRRTGVEMSLDTAGTSACATSVGEECERGAKRVEGSPSHYWFEALVCSGAEARIWNAGLSTIPSTIADQR